MYFIPNGVILCLYALPIRILVTYFPCTLSNAIPIALIERSTLYFSFKILCISNVDNEFMFKLILTISNILTRQSHIM